MAAHGMAHLRAFQWRAAVLDEAHRLKGRNSKVRPCGGQASTMPDHSDTCAMRLGQVAQALRTLSMAHRVLLTGTPLQNNLEELWSLLHFLDAKRFPSSEAFLASYGNLQSQEDVTRLQTLLQPLMLRRLKDDVVRV
jgi:chromodomain-helicase-DNA-binding protein 7